MNGGSAGVVSVIGGGVIVLEWLVLVLSLVLLVAMVVY